MQKIFPALFFRLALHNDRRYVYQYWTWLETVWGLREEDMDSSNKALTIMDSRTVNKISVIKPLLLRAYLEEAFNSMIIVAIIVFRPTIWASDCLRGKALSPIANSAII